GRSHGPGVSAAADPTASLGAGRLGRSALGLSRGSLKAAGHCALELVGPSVVFFVVNLVVGLPVILAVRALTSQFLSVYPLHHLIVVGLARIAGLLFWLL